MESGSVPAFWKYNDLSLRQSYWLAMLGPFQQGDRVEYAVVGMSDVETLSPQVFAFNVEQQKRIINMVKDPVCGMTVDENTAAGKSAFEGITYYFCAPGCKKVFDKDTRRFLKEPGKTLEAIYKPLTKYIDAQPKHKHQTQEGE
jgi:YHS domain-containing protein